MIQQAGACGQGAGVDRRTFKTAAQRYTERGAEATAAREEKSGEGRETTAAGPRTQALDPGATPKAERRLLAALARPIGEISRGYEKVVKCVRLVRSPSPTR